MTLLIKYSFICLIVFFGLPLSGLDDIYIIYYATYDGKSGHVGVAVDNYELRQRKYVNGNGVKEVIRDSVKTGNLTYYDLWPKKDELTKSLLTEDVEAAYFKLPASSSEKKINLYALTTRGIPHKEGYPCDGILRIKTIATMDFFVKEFIAEIVKANLPFNTRSNNCANFTEAVVEYVLQTDINTLEYIPFQYSATPNKLFREVSKIPGVQIVKDPGSKMNGSFWTECVMKRN